MGRRPRVVKVSGFRILLTGVLVTGMFAARAWAVDYRIRTVNRTGKDQVAQIYKLPGLSPLNNFARGQNQNDTFAQYQILPPDLAELGDVLFVSNPINRSDIPSTMDDDPPEASVCFIGYSAADHDYIPFAAFWATKDGVSTGDSVGSLGVSYQPSGSNGVQTALVNTTGQAVMLLNARVSMTNTDAAMRTDFPYPPLVRRGNSSGTVPREISTTVPRIAEFTDEIKVNSPLDNQSVIVLPPFSAATGEGKVGPFTLGVPQQLKADASLRVIFRCTLVRVSDIERLNPVELTVRDQPFAILPPVLTNRWVRAIQLAQGVDNAHVLVEVGVDARDPDTSDNGGDTPQIIAYAPYWSTNPDPQQPKTLGVNGVDFQLTSSPQLQQDQQDNLSRSISRIRLQTLLRRDASQKLYYHFPFGAVKVGRDNRQQVSYGFVTVPVAPAGP